MVLMALDHARDFFHQGGVDPTDPERAGPALFFTRWITHFCAPLFVFLAGAGSWLNGRRLGPPAALSRLLVARGLWLVVLEFTLIKFGWSFNWGYNVVVLQVFWAIGISMLVLAGLVFLPRGWIAGFGLSLIVFHNAFDGVRLAPGHPAYAGWSLLHQGAFIPVREGFALFPLYPLIPWIGVMAVGYAFGPCLEWPETERRQQLGRLGIGLTLSFLVLRAINLYGDPAPWRSAVPWWQAGLSFLNTTKYPPSLAYLLMTLGPGLALLAVGERLPAVVIRVFRVFGRVPLFYYVLHVPLLHLGAAVTAGLLGRGEQAGFLWHNPPFRGAPAPIGYGLPWVYLAWLAVVAALFPACQAFGRLKDRHRGRFWTQFV